MFKNVYKRCTHIARRNVSTANNVLPLETGTVTWFDKRKGYGFIERGVELPKPTQAQLDSKDLSTVQTPFLFVRFADIESSGETFSSGAFRYLRPGQKVEYYADVHGLQGTRCARQVQTIEEQ